MLNFQAIASYLIALVSLCTTTEAHGHMAASQVDISPAAEAHQEIPFQGSGGPNEGFYDSQNGGAYDSNEAPPSPQDRISSSPLIFTPVFPHDPDDEDEEDTEEHQLLEGGVRHCRANRKQGTQPQRSLPSKGPTPKRDANFQWSRDITFEASQRHSFHQLHPRSAQHHSHNRRQNLCMSQLLASRQSTSWGHDFLSHRGGNANWICDPPDIQCNRHRKAHQQPHHPTMVMKAQIQDYFEHQSHHRNVYFSLSRRFGFTEPTNAVEAARKRNDLTGLGFYDRTGLWIPHTMRKYHRELQLERREQSLWQQGAPHATMEAAQNARGANESSPSTLSVPQHMQKAEDLTDLPGSPNAVATGSATFLTQTFVANIDLEEEITSLSLKSAPEGTFKACARLNKFIKGEVPAVTEKKFIRGSSANMSPSSQLGSPQSVSIANMLAPLMGGGARSTEKLKESAGPLVTHAGANPEVNCVTNRNTLLLSKNILEGSHEAQKELGDAAVEHENTRTDYRHIPRSDSATLQAKDTCTGEVTVWASEETSRSAPVVSVSLEGPRFDEAEEPEAAMAVGVQNPYPLSNDCSTVDNP
ncbi:hypothetical protein cyc_01889 [Cyclospora cayetanensis]|uniref:Uncharacterized protein n=1 Tax=Cyclospora cayetanensis TaxID=88456 RepID=A0A1D3D0S2_9EIME|nr:hypothetical protein cyc_01889 [Cyclospora cayetanensis]